MVLGVGFTGWIFGPYPLVIVRSSELHGTLAFASFNAINNQRGQSTMREIESLKTEIIMRVANPLYFEIF